MATQPKTDPISESIEAATEKATAFTEKAAENGRKASSVLLDSYEKTVLAVADAYVKAARSTNVEWISVVSSAQADFAREAAKSYTSAARVLVA